MTRADRLNNSMTWRWWIATILATLAATWPIHLWTARRTVDGSDDPWGILAVVSLATLLAVRGMRSRSDDRRHNKMRPTLNPRSLLLPTCVLTTYALTYSFLLPLMRGVLALTAVSMLLAQIFWRRRFHLGVWGLCVLTLPVSASLHFYLGYPLRALVAVVAAKSLRGAGLGVSAQGAGLQYGDQLVLVDAPCAGINMLWVGGWLVCVLICALDLDMRASLLASVTAAVLVVFGNALRAASLFYLEAGLIPMGDGAHTVIGLIVFSVTAAAICRMMLFLQHAQEKRCTASAS